MTFTQQQNCLMTHFTEHIPIVKRCISVFPPAPVIHWLHAVQGSMVWGDQNTR